MPKNAIWNFIIGFSIIFLSAAAGSFLALDMTDAYVATPQDLESWKMTLSKSAHGHFNLMGYLHVLFGLTVSYSLLSSRIKNLQTFGILAGSIAMGPMLWVRSFSAPSNDFSPSSLVIGLLISLMLAALAAHIYGLALKLAKRS